MKKYFLYITLIMVLICPSLSLCEESSSNYEPIYRFINKYNEIVSEPIQIVSEDVVKHRLSTFNGYPIVHIYIGEDENSRFSNGSIQTYRYRGFRMMFYCDTFEAAKAVFENAIHIIDDSISQELIDQEFKLNSMEEITSTLVRGENNNVSFYLSRQFRGYKYELFIDVEEYTERQTP